MKNTYNEVILKNGDLFLFSYTTIVAAVRRGGGLEETDRHYSVTTSKHIAKFKLEHKDKYGLMACKVSPEFLKAKYNESFGADRVLPTGKQPAANPGQAI